MDWKHGSKGALLSLSLMMSAPLSAHALSLGELKVDSQLGEAFLAEVPMTLRADEVSQGVKVTLGMPTDYRVLELERLLAVSSLSLEVIGVGANRKIRIVSSAPFREPFFNLLLKTSVGRGSYFRNFPVFLNILPEKKAVTPLAGFKKSSPSSALSGSSLASSPRGFSKTPVIDRPTSRIAESLPTEVVEVVPQDAPLVSDQVNSLPSSTIQRTSLAKQALPPPSVAEQEGVESYGPVGEVETLTSIARNIQGNSDWSIAQIAVALWKKNKSSFLENNMSGLQSGTILTVPSAAEIAALSPTQASNEFKHQWSKWQQLTQKGGKAEVPVTAPKKNVAQKPASKPPEQAKQQPEVAMDLILTPGDTMPQAADEQEVVPVEAVENKGGDPDLNAWVAVTGQVSQLSGQVDALAVQLNQFSTHLASSEKQRAGLEKRLTKLESRLMDEAPAKKAVAEKERDNGLLYPLAGGGLVAVLVGLLFWLRKPKPKSEWVTDSQAGAMLDMNSLETNPSEPGGEKPSGAPLTNAPLADVPTEEPTPSDDPKGWEEVEEKEDEDDEREALRSSPSLPEESEQEPEPEEEEEVLTATTEDIVPSAPPQQRPDVSAPMESESSEDASIDTIEFIPVEKPLKSPPTKPLSEDSSLLETISFTPIDQQEGPETPAPSLPPSREDEGPILEIDLDLEEEPLFVAPPPRKPAKEDDNGLVLEIEFDLEEANNPKR
ncbi:MAG: hypothetical protein HQL72_13465 [Magnetococcales bacterium]|nr:hypothetical protein [Magnetococcales bacterium]